MAVQLASIAGQGIGRATALKLASAFQENFKEFILAEGIHALGFIPLRSHGKLLGKLMVYYDEPHPFSPPDVQLAEMKYWIRKAR